VLAWAILFFCFVKIYCAGNFAYIILRAVDAQGGDFSWITGVQLEPRNFWKTKLPARHPNRTMDGRHATDMYPNGEDGRFLGLVEDETKPSIPPAGNPSKQASEDY